MRVITVSGWIFNDPQMEKTKSGNDSLHFKMTNWQYGDPVTPDGKHKSLFIDVYAFEPSLFNLLTKNVIKKNKHITVMGDIQSLSGYVAKDGQPGVGMSVRAKSIYLDDYIGNNNQQGQNGQVANVQQGYAQPQQYVQQAPQGYAQPQQQYAQQVPQGYAQSQQQYAQQAPQGYAQPQQQYAQQPMMQPVGYTAGAGNAGEQVSEATRNALNQFRQDHPEVQPNGEVNGDLPF